MPSPRVYDERHDAILRAALSVVEDSGPEAVSMASLGRMTGLSRPAIYQYFASREHVLGELVINEMADLSNEIDRLMRGISDPLEQVRIWVHYCLAHLSSANHRIIRQISLESLPEDQRGMTRAMHALFMTSLISPLVDLGSENPTAVSSMIFGSVAAAAERIDRGAYFVDEAKALERFVLASLDGSA